MSNVSTSSTTTGTPQTPVVNQAGAINAPHGIFVPKKQIGLTPRVYQKPSEFPVRDERIDNIISGRLKRFRSEAWEDDISRNTMDDKPFENRGHVGTNDLSWFENQQRFTPKTLGDKSIYDMVARDTFPIPSIEDREGYSPDSDVLYWASGLGDYLKLMAAAKRHGTEVKSYFDFGCASGRVLRHFACQSDIPDIWGSDINARHIRWLSEFMPRQVRPIANHCIPSLPLADNSVDLVSAFSVFTHIDTFELCWLAELRRVLSTNGIAFLTVHNEDTWLALRSDIENPDNRLIQSIRKVDPDTDKKLMLPLRDTRTVYRFTPYGPYRAQVFHSNSYLEKVWGRFFDILEILPCHHVRQSVVVLRKR